MNQAWYLKLRLLGPLSPAELSPDFLRTTPNKPTSERSAVTPPDSDKLTAIAAGRDDVMPTAITQFDEIYAVGDSMSDSGGIYQLSTI